jgi:hypothetical protein
LAGRDTSEWAYDCSDVRPTMKQARAHVYRSYPVTRGDVRCSGHDYAARLSLPASIPVKRIEIQWTGGAAATLSLKKISLLDESAGNSLPVVPVAGSLADTTRWRHVTDINFENSGYGAIKPEDVGEAGVYENLRARPRVWLVGKVLTVTEEEALSALHSSRLADGSAFDPAQVALVEEPLDFPAQSLDREATARVRHLSDGRMEVPAGRRPWTARPRDSSVRTMPCAVSPCPPERIQFASSFGRAPFTAGRSSARPLLCCCCSPQPSSV